MSTETDAKGCGNTGERVCPAELLDTALVSEYMSTETDAKGCGSAGERVYPAELLDGAAACAALSGREQNVSYV